MPASVVTATSRRDSTNGHESISHLWVGPRKIPVADVIRSINAGQQFVSQRIVGPQISPWPDDRRGPHVRSHANGHWNDNLLSLPIK
jgi:hypothetical protein